MALRLPTGSTGLTVAHEQSGSGSTTGSLKTVGSGKTAILNQFTAWAKASTGASARATVWILIDGDRAFAISLDPDTDGSGSTNSKGTSDKRDICIVLDDGQTVNIEAENETANLDCGGAVSGFEFIS